MILARQPYINEEIERNGFAVLPKTIEEENIADLRRAFDSLRKAEQGKQREGGLFAARNVMAASPVINALACSSIFLGTAQRILGEPAHPVRSLLFDKIASANWRVPWHQDLTIAVRKRQDAEGYGPWSVKSGIPHVQPPISILERMITLRLHLDDCRATNGALKVIPGSHQHGKMNPAQIEECVQNGLVHLCELAAGDILLMKPLLLHSSSTATIPTHRRVVHIEYCSAPLAHKLEWGEVFAR